LRRVAVRVHDGDELGEKRSKVAVRVVGQVRGALVSDGRQFVNAKKKHAPSTLNNMMKLVEI
jgi:hypothetical protein